MTFFAKIDFRLIFYKFEMLESRRFRKPKENEKIVSLQVFWKNLYFDEIY